MLPKYTLFSFYSTKSNEIFSARKSLKTSRFPISRGLDLQQCKGRAIFVLLSYRRIKVISFFALSIRRGCKGITGQRMSPSERRILSKMNENRLRCALYSWDPPNRLFMALIYCKIKSLPKKLSFATKN